MKFIIPARKGSTGFPNKNRYLFKHTAEILKEYSSDVIVSTNDDHIASLARKFNFCVHNRTEENARNISTTHAIMKEIVDFYNFEKNETLVMLYLTYPGRKFEDIKKAISFFEKSNSNSMLCYFNPDDSPYLMMYKIDDNRGEPVIKHNLCRRQDYRPCMRICHYIVMFKSIELKHLNNDLYNSNTTYMELEKKPWDIDTMSQFEKFLKEEQV